MHSTAITLRPSFVSFTPWTTLEDYREVLRFIERRGIVDWVDPIQLAIRLLIPPGSLLLELPEVRDLVGPLEPQSFTHAWVHPDLEMDALYRAASERVEAGARAKADAAETFSALWVLAGLSRAPRWERRPSVQLTESWFCCAEPSRDQFVALRASAGENRK